MAQLKKSIIKQVEAALESNNLFSREDFGLRYSDGSQYLVFIKFIAHPQYSLTIQERYTNLLATVSVLGGDKGKRFFQTIECPGDFKNQESNSFQNINDCIYRISDWVRNLHEDLILREVKPENDLDDFTENLRKQLDENTIENPDDHFSFNESESLKLKLNELNERVIELEKRYKLTKEDIAPLESAIKSSKDNVDNYPKRVWYRTSGNKILSALNKIAKTKEVRDFLLEAAKKFFLN